MRGLSLVDVNHPQHTTAVGLTPKKLSAALSSAGLAAGAVCLRFPSEEYSLGAFSNPDPAVRAKAVQLSVDGCHWAAQLGARDLILWTQFDGYDYSFQVTAHAVCTADGVIALYVEMRLPFQQRQPPPRLPHPHPAAC